MPRVTTTDEPWLHYGCTDSQKELSQALIGLKAQAPKRSIEEQTTAAASPTNSQSPSQKPKKLSMMAAALMVLQDRQVAMTCPEIIDVLATEGLWVSPGGKTPTSTLYAAITRRIRDLGNGSPFKKAERGKFEVA